MIRRHSYPSGLRLRYQRTIPIRASVFLPRIIARRARDAPLRRSRPLAAPWQVRSEEVRADSEGEGQDAARLDFVETDAALVGADFFGGDGFHPGEHGYRRWAQLVAEAAPTAAPTCER